MTVAIIGTPVRRSAFVVRRLVRATLLLALAGAAAGCQQQKEETPEASTDTMGGAEVAAAASTANPLRDAYFGELHLHTSWSFDAYSFQNTLIDPDAAYRYAKGEAVKHPNGSMVKRNTPLDFAAVTDHAEYLGVARLFADPQHPLYQKPVAALVRSGDPKDGLKAFRDLGTAATQGHPDPDLVDPKLVAPLWKQMQDFAAAHYAPGKFTTFIGFEWTSTPNLNNLHRNVLFAGTQVPELPFSAVQSSRPEDLWTYIENARAAGSDAITIPHNSNLSNGLMFATKDSNGKPFTREYAERRASMEPLVELIQLKGNSETTPARAPNDEFAGFEQYMYQLGSGKVLPGPRTSFVREALKSGLELNGSLGANPYKYGLVAASDSHDGTAVPEENNFNGGHGVTDKDPHERLQEKSPLSDKTKFSASGLTGVWAEENTREAIFAALKRRETFATSGTFIKTRFFGGWGYSPAMMQSSNWVSTAYSGGVPMGADLPERPAEAKAPSFAISALKDPKSANLDRIQVVKGWLDAKGKAHEKIFDVALADDRRRDASGKIPPVGDTVDAAKATYTNDIGDPELSIVWSDPEFDPAQPAFYYARVLEIPTPRWTTYDAVALGIEPPQPATIQERAWTSPIWYTPK
jgi:hypothetical protein